MILSPNSSDSTEPGQRIGGPATVGWEHTTSKCLKVSIEQLLSRPSQYQFVMAITEQVIGYLFKVIFFLLLAVLCVPLTQFTVSLPSNWGKAKAFLSWQKASFFLLSWWVGLYEYKYYIHITYWLIKHFSRSPLSLLL